jgi:hypothetical protein
MMTRVDGSNTKSIRKAAQSYPLDVLDLAGQKMHIYIQNFIEVVVFYQSSIDVRARAITLRILLSLLSSAFRP